MRRCSPRPRARGFTLLEVALIVAIIGMMLLMIIGYLRAPTRSSGDLSATPPTPVPSTPAFLSPRATTPTSSPAPAKPIEITPDSAPTFR